MGLYRDRMAARQSPTSLESSPVPGDDLAVVAANPVAERAKVAITYILTLTKGSKAANSPGFKIATKLVTEAMNDLGDSPLPPAIASLYIKQMSAIMYWVADGTRPEGDYPWPEDFQV